MSATSDLPATMTLAQALVTLSGMTFPALRELVESLGPDDLEWVAENDWLEIGGMINGYAHAAIQGDDLGDDAEELSVQVLRDAIEADGAGDEP